MVIDLIQNAALLVMLSVFLRVPAKFRTNNLLLYKIILGLSFGIIASVGMLMPLQYQEGVFFDGRSIIISLAGLFGGAISAGVSVLISAGFRIYIGGAGTTAGVATVIVCALLGILFRRLYKNKPETIPWHILWGMGIVVHIAMLLCQLLIPAPMGMQVIRGIFIPILVIFPIIFVLISLLLSSELQKIQAEESIRKAEQLFRATLYSIGDAVMTLDPKGRVMQINHVAEKLTGYTEAEAKNKSIGEVFPLYSETSGERIKNPVEKVIAEGKIIGLANHTVLQNRYGKHIPISDSAAPITDKSGNIIGVVLVFKDETEQRKQRALLEGSEAKYRRLVEAHNAVVWEYDAFNDKWSYISPDVEQLLGWKPEEWTDLTFAQKNTHPDDRKNILKIFTKYKRSGGEFSFEYRFKTKDGNYRWLLNTADVEMPDGKPQTLRGIMFDISKRKEYELALKEKNEFIQTVLDSLPIGIALNKIKEGSAFYVNKRFEEIYGWPLDELKDINLFFAKVYPDTAYREQIISRIMTDINSGIPENMHWENIEITKKDGSKGIVNAVNIPLFEQNIMVSTVIDVTKQKMTEKALRDSEEQFRKLFENHSAVHLLIDPDTGKIMNANQAAADFYGWTTDTIKTMKIYDINLLPEAEIKKEITRARNNKGFQAEFQHRLADGTIRHVEVFSSVTELQGKNFLHSVVHDITDRKSLMEEIIQAKEKAEESDKLKSAFLANISHEIRTPLNGILGFTILLTDGTELSTEKRKSFSRIVNRSAENLMHIIDDILDISKLEAGQFSLDIKNCNITKLLKDTRTLYLKKMAERNKTHIDLLLDIPEQELFFDTDEIRLTQIFINLLDNAVKFTEEGKITFGIKAADERSLHFYVSDTGIGIAKEKHELIFERFAQAEHDISKKYGGTGLGLSIVKRLCELLGGNIQVKSAPGEGAYFQFSIGC